MPRTEPADQAPETLTAPARALLVCSRCGVAADRAHLLESDCLRGLDAELSWLRARSQSLLSRRLELVRRMVYRWQDAHTERVRAKSETHP